ncbi:hypothetical protein P280DRAFT_447395 [Massarina eburnea CBS 473.64]|uniref:MFS general substrate transporter n=1 Tax=Massarina eburnea CBS 473.64 TaxID=1395130 RepID=A0A6A6S6X0_9PLEO|nr:hypothetical protein P280DRAFT_447395 [Massarina eburnea CBS 473.64]
MGIAATWAYKQQHWRAPLIAASVLVATCHAGSSWIQTWWGILLVRGVGLGASLGYLRSTGLLLLASHYKNNVALASMQSAFAALTGAAVYTIILHVCLSHDSLVCAGMSQFGLSLGSLIIASALIRRSRRYDAYTHSPTVANNNGPGSLCFLIGHYISFSGIFIFPTFFLLLMSSGPAMEPPLQATFWYIGSLLGGALVAAYAASDYARTHLGPLNTYIPASIIAGTAYFNPAWMPYTYILGPCCVAYCMCLGPMLAMWVKAPTVFYRLQRPWEMDAAWSDRCCALVGVLAATGVVVMGVMVHTMGSMKGGFTVFGGLMVLGGVLMGVGRWMGWRKWNVVV